MNKLKKASFLRTMTALAFMVPLAACAVGPDFMPPAAPKTKSYGPNGTPAKTVEAKTQHGGIQRFVADGDIPAAWWKLYESAPLNYLINRAVVASPSLEAAQASLRVAQENASAGYGSFFPTIDGSTGVNRSKTTSGTNPYTLYNATVSVSYAPDVFGGTRRSVESLDAKTEASRFELEATYLTLTTNIVTTAIQEASLRGQIYATKEIILTQEKQLKIMKAQWDAGAIAKPAYLSQKTTVATSKTALPALENSLSKTRTLLSVLLGQLPSKTIGAQFNLSSFKLPTDVPVSLPSKLVEQRPDIRQARANLHDASAQIGIAKAAMLPQFPLTGNYGVSATRLADLFSPTTALWGLGAGLAQPLFHGGTLLHQKRSAEAGFDAQAAIYRHTVLSAFKDVADALTTLEANALTLKAQLDAEKAAKESLALTTKQYNAGAVSYTALLTAQASYQQATLGLITAKADRLTGTAVLLQALGGGWWNKTELNTETDVTK